MDNKNYSKTTSTEIEESMKRIHYDSYDEWIKNFATNLDNIWKESSAGKIITIGDEVSEKEEPTAIVIGRGPSIKKKNHLELLSKSDFKGKIVCCDGALIDALKAGVTPEKFPNFYVVTIDPIAEVKKFYDDDIVNKYGSKIKGIFTVISHPSVVERARKAGIKIHWMHSLFDYNEGRKSFNYISALLVRTKNHTNGLPAIQTGGNVGTSSWFVSWKILKCSKVILIGINHGWEEDDSRETIIRHGLKHLSINIEESDHNFKKLFPKIFNPDIQKYCILDPIFQFYSTAFKEFISRAPSWVSTINATEGGSIFGERIKSSKLKDILKTYD